MMASLGSIYFMIILADLHWLSDCQLAKMEKLHKIDNQVSLFTQYLIKAIIHQQTGIRTTQIDALKNIGVAGSTKEGTMLARVFSPTNATDGLNREIEADLEYNLMDIPKQYKSLIDDIPEKEGLIRVRADMSLLRFASKVGWKVESKDHEELLDKVSADGYLKPYLFTEAVLGKVEFHNDPNKFGFILAAALNIELNRVSISRSSQRVTKSSVGNYIDILVDNKVKIKLSWDIATVMKIHWWPDVAKEWIERERQWPNKGTISDLSRFVYITTIPSDNGKDEKDTFELRYSFAHIERALMAKRSRRQSFVYFVFKSMLYKWVKPLDSDRIHSFIAKTVMFWMCEKHSPDDSLWLEANTIAALKLLFSEVLKSVEMHQLPYYFIPKINVIAKLDEALRKKVAQQIELILTNIEQFVPDNVDEAIVTCKEMLNIMKASYKVVDDISKKNYKLFIKRPDLLPKAAEIYGSQLLKETVNQYKDEL